MTFCQSGVEFLPTGIVVRSLECCSIISIFVGDGNILPNIWRATSSSDAMKMLPRVLGLPTVGESSSSSSWTNDCEIGCEHELKTTCAAARAGMGTLSGDSSITCWSCVIRDDYSSRFTLVYSNSGKLTSRRWSVAMTRSIFLM